MGTVFRLTKRWYGEANDEQADKEFLEKPHGSTSKLKLKNAPEIATKKKSLLCYDELRNRSSI
jgi:hypothetical protein